MHFVGLTILGIIIGGTVDKIIFELELGAEVEWKKEKSEVRIKEKEDKISYIS